MIRYHKDGIKYTAGTYTGTSIGKTGFNHRYGVQIVATDEQGIRRYVFVTFQGKSPCYKYWEGVAHYKSGLNKKDRAACAEALTEAHALANTWNEGNI